jgi:hypothetical protein
MIEGESNGRFADLTANIAPLSWIANDGRHPQGNAIRPIDEG